MSTSDDLRKLADRFSAGWHDGIKIDASDVMLLTDAAAEIERLLSESDERLKNTVAQEMEIERLRKGLSEVEFLIKESAGVYGLHLNGELSPWGSLRTGGEYEAWLVEFDNALEQTP